MVYFWSFLPHFTHLLVVLRQKKQEVAIGSLLLFCFPSMRGVERREQNNPVRLFCSLSYYSASFSSFLCTLVKYLSKFLPSFAHLEDTVFFLLATMLRIL